MYVLKSDKVLFVDVDNTLVTWVNDKWEPNYKYVTLMKQFKTRGQSVVVWSAGGHQWATKVIEELGLQELVDVILSKPAWYADDMHASEFMPEINRIYFKD